MQKHSKIGNNEMENEFYIYIFTMKSAILFGIEMHAKLRKFEFPRLFLVIVVETGFCVCSEMRECISYIRENNMHVNIQRIIN